MLEKIFFKIAIFQEISEFHNCALINTPGETVKVDVALLSPKYFNQFPNN